MLLLPDGGMTMGLYDRDYMKDRPATTGGLPGAGPGNRRRLWVGLVVVLAVAALVALLAMR